MVYDSMMVYDDLWCFVIVFCLCVETSLSLIQSIQRIEGLSIHKYSSSRKATQNGANPLQCSVTILNWFTPPVCLAITVHQQHIMSATEPPKRTQDWKVTLWKNKPSFKTGWFPFNMVYSVEICGTDTPSGKARGPWTWCFFPRFWGSGGASVTDRVRRFWIGSESGCFGSTLAIHCKLLPAKRNCKPSPHISRSNSVPICSHVFTSLSWPPLVHHCFRSAASFFWDFDLRYECRICPRIGCPKIQYIQWFVPHWNCKFGTWWCTQILNKPLQTQK